MADRQNRRTFPFDGVRAYEGMRKRAYRALVLGGNEYDVVAEPLLRRSRDGAGSQQPLRFRPTHAARSAAEAVSAGSAASGRSDASSSDSIRAQLPPSIEVRQPGADWVRADAEPVAGGARFFIDVVQDSVTVEIRLPGETAVARVDVAPVRQWEISLVPSSHFDIGYTDPQGQVIHEQLAYLDHALRLAEAESGLPDTPHTFRWSVESVWLLVEWMDRRSSSDIERMIRQIQLGKIEVSALPFNVHTEACSTEELHGLLRHAQRLNAEHDLQIPMAYQTDIPGCVAGTVDALAQSGVKYLSVAHNWAGRSIPYLNGGEHLPRFFRWASPGGSSVHVWTTTTAEGMAYQEGANMGFASSLDDVEEILPLFLTTVDRYGYPWGSDIFGFPLGDREFDREPYPYDELHMRVMGRPADNCPPNRRLSEIVEAWNEKWVYPRLAVTTTESFFDTMVQRHGDEVQTFTGDWNNWWVDGVGSAARQMKINRATQAGLSQAATVEALAALTANEPSGESPQLAGFADRLEDAWLAAELFDEHTWGSANPWRFTETGRDAFEDMWIWKAEKALRGEQGALLLTQEVARGFAEAHGDGCRDLTSRSGADAAPAAAPTVETASIYVINTSGEGHGGLARCFVPESRIHTTSFVHLTDPATGQAVEFSERDQVNPIHREAGRWLEFHVDNVPAAGFRRFLVSATGQGGRSRSMDGTLPAVEPGDATWRLSNERVAVEVDPRTGVIRSIVVDDVEIVNRTSAFGFNSYIHDELTIRGGFVHISGFFADHGADQLIAGRHVPNRAAFEDAGEDGVTSWLRFRSECVGVDGIVTTIRLTAGQSHVDIENRLTFNGTMNKDCGYFAFPFAAGAAAPVVRYEITGSVAGSDIPTVPGGLEHLHAVQSWVTAHADGRAYTLVSPDVPLAQIGNIAVPFPPYKNSVPNPQNETGTVFSWVHNNLWDTNFPEKQSIDTVFRYRVGAPEAATPEAAGVAAARLAGDLVRPLLATVTASAVGLDSGSALEISDSRVRLLGLRRDPAGRTLTVALQSLAEIEIECAVLLRAPAQRAWSATLTGERQQELPLADGAGTGRTRVAEVTVRLPRFGTTGLVIEL